MIKKKKKQTEKTLEIIKLSMATTMAIVFNQIIIIECDFSIDISYVFVSGFFFQLFSEPLKKKRNPKLKKVNTYVMFIK